MRYTISNRKKDSVVVHDLLAIALCHSASSLEWVIVYKVCVGDLVSILYADSPRIYYWCTIGKTYGLSGGKILLRGEEGDNMMIKSKYRGMLLKECMIDRSI